MTPYGAPGFPTSTGDRRQLAEWWRFYVDAAAASGWEWWVSDGCEAASAWVPPGLRTFADGYRQRVRPLLEELLGPAAAGPVLDGFERLAAAHPDEPPHFYLAVVGTCPEHRGQGIGARLLEHCLSRVDAERLPAYLESTNPLNVRLYERLGFVRRDDVALAARGLVVTSMWRAAR